MRAIEKQIIRKMKELTEGDTKDHNLSPRDRVYMYDKNRHYRLHGNLVFIVKSTNEVWVSSQGWKTNTTKSRINALLEGFGYKSGIYQKDFVWYWTNGQEFHDGVYIYREDGQEMITQGGRII